MQQEIKNEDSWKWRRAVWMSHLGSEKTLHGFGVLFGIRCLESYPHCFSHTWAHERSGQQRALSWESLGGIGW
jgi:hypothetical protein